MIVIADKKYNFIEMFNPNNGFYVRTGIIEKGKDTGVDPFMRSFPSLLDIGVMGHCKHGTSGLCIKSGVECYQSGYTKEEPNMSIENYKRIVDECKGKVFQFALGGRGDVDQHEHFEEIMKYTRENGIVPNFTSSGLGFTKEIAEICKKYAGSVAISWYGYKYTFKAIELLIEAGVKTNIHYVVSNTSIDDAIRRLKENDFPEGINAVIFLLHKPVGHGSQFNVLKHNDPRVKEFYELTDTGTFKFKIGFDSCHAPGLVNFTKNIDFNTLEACDASLFSAYISPTMQMTPCSFDQEMRWAADLNKHAIQEAWGSEQFENFRNRHRAGGKTACSSCEHSNKNCRPCPITPEIVLCDKGEDIITNDPNVVEFIPLKAL